MGFRPDRSGPDRPSSSNGPRRVCLAKWLFGETWGTKAQNHHLFQKRMVSAFGGKAKQPNWVLIKFYYGFNGF